MKTSFLAVLLFLFLIPEFLPVSVSQAREKGGDLLLKTLRKDAEGIYLSHIPQAFSLSVIAVRPGTFYSGTISDPGGAVRILSRQAPRKEIVLERLSKDRIRFSLAPIQVQSPDTFSFQTRTGCFTLIVWQNPPRHLPLIHLNGYTPPVQKMPVIFCGHGHHIRYEWQGPYPGK
ncbi:MAG: hypothetical protein M1297_01390 [Nitrospirae bacterium]|nr:hypothetical protein [Nitrospirota bacterium]